MSQALLCDKEVEQYQEILLNENMLFEMSVVPQMIVGKDRHIIKINKKFSELFQYSAEEIIGHKTVELTPSKELFCEYEKYFVQTKEGIFKSEELQYKRKDRSLFWTRLEGIQIHQKNDEVLILWSFINIDKEVKYREELKHLASIDYLTGLFNRRFFSDMSLSVLELAKREKRDISLILLDIDKFKNINDNYGHKVGDDVIIKFSEILKENTRKSDIICRFGGEEFIILLPDTNLNNAKNIAMSLKNTFEKYTFILENNQSLQVTASFGISEVKVQKENSFELCFKRVDDALYKAKHTGRNRVVLN